MAHTDIHFVYFGGEPLGVPVLEELKAVGLLPRLVVASPDKPTGRKQELTSPPVKKWAEANNIEVFQPKTYKDDSAKSKLSADTWDLFVVVAYNFILPEWLLSIPTYQTINLHPSLLPELRGASPIRTAILNDLREDIGVTIIKLDSEMDHGPILEQMHMPIADENWPLSGPELDLALARMGGSLLGDTIPSWIAGDIELQEQPHELASYCNRLQKSDSEILLDPHNLPTGKEGRKAWLKINAFTDIGETFFIHNSKRVKITKAEFAGGKLRLLRVIPEGKKEINFTQYLNSIT